MAVRALDIAASGIMFQSKTIDNIANNIANANTIGFKAGFLSGADLIYQNEQVVGAPVTAGSDLVVPVGIQFGSGVRVDGVIKNFGQGDTISTGEALNLAIVGDGFFVVDLPDGSQAYTRNGIFHIDPTTNQIVTSMGYVLDPGITVPQNHKKIIIRPDGSIFAELPGQEQLEQLGQINLASFINRGGLSAIGDNLYQQTDASGEPIINYPGQENFGTLMQGWLENSNVNAISEVTNLIKAQRAYEMNAKVIEAADQILRTIIDATT
jgi:flagellar basal-body rod protein FlgG